MQNWLDVTSRAMRGNEEDGREGISKRREFQKRMACVQSEQDFRQVVTDILSWGGMNPFGFEEVRSLRRSRPVMPMAARGFIQHIQLRIEQEGWTWTIGPTRGQIIP